MFISDFAIKRPIITIVSMLALVVFGLVSLFKLDTDEFPDFVIIVAKNAILLIDFAKWSHKDRGLSLRDALIEAGRIRLRPIMMTTIALVAGMIPVALGYGEGADFRAPLGRAVIGGVIASTVLTLVVIPTVYEIMEEWRERLLSRFTQSLTLTHEPVGVTAARAHGDD